MKDMKMKPAPRFDNYELIYVENDKPISVKTFYATDSNGASKFVEDYNKEHQDRTYYFKYARHPWGLWHIDGITSWGLSEVDNWFVDKIAKLRIKLRELDKKMLSSTDLPPLQLKRRETLKKIASIRRKWGCKAYKFLVKCWVWTCDQLEWYCKDKWINKFDDWKHERKRVRYFKKHHHDLQEAWSLDWHMLEDLKWNLKRLIEDSCGIPSQFIMEAIAEDHKDDPNFDIDGFYMQNISLSTYDDKAIQKRNDTYNRIIHLIDLYDFYSGNHSWTDDIKKTPDMVMIYKNDGSWHEEDYLAMSNKSKVYWDEIWDLVKKYGMTMGD